MSEEERIAPTRASLASVDARVARLEQAQAETDSKVALIQLEQTHTRELMNSRFTTLEVGIAGQGKKLDDFIARIEAMVMEATKSSGDLTASPVGRQVDSRITKLESRTELHNEFIDQLKGMGTAMRWVVGTSVLGFLVSLVSLATSAGFVGPVK